MKKMIITISFLLAAVLCLCAFQTAEEEPVPVSVPNLLDRMIHGSVTDLFELLFVRFYIFNLADVLICTGAFLLFVSFIVSERKKSRAYGQ